MVEVFHRAGGTDAAVAVASQRRGTQFDPRVVDAFTGQAESVFAGLEEASSWDAVIGAEPALGAWLAGPELDAALEAVADFTDVKSPYTIGHPRAVADLAARAARMYGLDDQAATLIRGRILAALEVHLIRQQRAQRVRVLGGQRPCEALTRAGRGGRPAVQERHGDLRGSSRPVVRLMTALPFMPSPLFGCLS